MMIPIDKIRVRDDRIRRDYGNIDELAEDINQNGLINPPVVNKEFLLLAGERRLRACKSLGWKQIEVRMMDTRDAEHELNVEISENENRKAFSKSERVDYMKRLLRIEQAKAKERQDLGEKSHEGGRSDEKTAEQFGISSNTLRKEISIVDHQDALTPEDFADWDEGKLSTNKAFQRIKAQLAEKDKTIEILKSTPQSTREKFERSRADRLQAEVEELKSRKPEVKKIEVIPEDYEKAKFEAAANDKKMRLYRDECERLTKRYEEKCRETLELEDKLHEMKSASMEGLDNSNLSENVFYFCTICNNFISNVGGLVWLTERIADMPKKEKEMFLKAAKAFNDWSVVFKENLERSIDASDTENHAGIPLLAD